MANLAEQYETGWKNDSALFAFAPGDLDFADFDRIVVGVLDFTTVFADGVVVPAGRFAARFIAIVVTSNVQGVNVTAEWIDDISGAQLHAFPFVVNTPVDTEIIIPLTVDLIRDMTTAGHDGGGGFVGELSFEVALEAVETFENDWDPPPVDLD